MPANRKTFQQIPESLAFVLILAAGWALLAAEPPMERTKAERPAAESLDIRRPEELLTIVARVGTHGDKVGDGFPGRHLVRRKIRLTGRPGDGRVKARNILDCKWHTFSLDSAWPAGILKRGEEFGPRVAVEADLYWHGPYVVPEENRPSVATNRVPGQVVPGAFQLSNVRVVAVEKR